MTISFRIYGAFIAMLLCAPLCWAEKVLIFTHSYNRPDFIALHAKTFKTFLKDDYEYVVFNDASGEDMKNQIEATCAGLGVRCIRIPQHLHLNNQPGWRHMDGIQYALDLIGYDHDGIVVLIDSDMFLIKPFSVVEYLKGYDLIGGEQWRENNHIRVTYIAPTVVFMNMKTAPNKRTINFKGGHVEGLNCDVGAHMYYYLKNNPTLRYRLFVAKSIQNMCPQAILSKDPAKLQAEGYDENSINFIFNTDSRYGFEFHGDTHFMHYYAGGSNWPGYSQGYLQEKNTIMYSFIEKQIEYYSK